MCWEWFLNGLWHRADGPAVTYADGAKDYVVNGKFLRVEGVR